MENKKTFSNFKLLLETKNIEENDSINIFNSQKELNSYFKKIIFEDFYWNISIKSNVKEVANLLVRFDRYIPIKILKDYFLKIRV
jgi:hypothetical protein